MDRTSLHNGGLHVPKVIGQCQCVLLGETDSASARAGREYGAGRPIYPMRREERSVGSDAGRQSLPTVLRLERHSSAEFQHVDHAQEGEGRRVEQAR